MRDTWSQGIWQKSLPGAGPTLSGPQVPHLYGRRMHSVIFQVVDFPLESAKAREELETGALTSF